MDKIPDLANKRMDRRRSVINNSVSADLDDADFGSDTKRDDPLLPGKKTDAGERFTLKI